MAMTKPSSSQVTYSGTTVNKVLEKSVLSYDTYSAASTAAATLPDGQELFISSDETLSGQVSKRKVEAGALKITPWMFGLPSVWSLRDPTDTSDSQMFQRAADAGGRWQVPAGTYNLNGVKVRTGVTFQCGNGVLFRRPAGADLTQSYWNDGVACFEVDRCGATLNITGGFEYDGQESLQTATEPTGFFVRAWATVDGTETVSVILDRPIFRNGTSGYILARGDDARRRWGTAVYLNGPEFYNTRAGYGKGDPATPTALGWSPNYCAVYDYVQFNAHNFTAEWLGNAPTGRYSAVAIFGSFYGQDYTTSGGVTLNLTGVTTVKRLGRENYSYNDPNQFSVNNGIGAIDCYGNSESLFVERLEAHECRNVPLRAKASIKNFTVLSALLVNCNRGIQVSPSSTGPCEAIVNIGAVVSYGGTLPQLEFVGTSATDRIKSVFIEDHNQLGKLTNPEGLSANSNGAVSIRNAEVIRAKIKTRGSVTWGLTLQNHVLASIDFQGDACDLGGIYSNGVGDIFLQQPVGKNLGGPLVNIFNSATPAVLNVFGGNADNVFNYVIQNNNTQALMTVDGLSMSNITGLSRGLYAPAGAFVVAKNNSAGVGVTSPAHYLNTGARAAEFGNSWNPAIRYGTATLTTSGTHRRGDIVYNTAPSAGGNIGWSCVADGAPGTWKTFGTIAA